jgi:hypothetical protein
LAFVPDKRVVQQFGSGGAHEAFGGGVCAWRSGRGVDHVDPVGGEDLVGRGDEHGGVVSDEEPEPVDVEGHGDVAGRLGAPAAGEMTGDAGEVDLAGGVFDEEQDVELAEPDGVDDEGVTGDDPAGLRSEELGPGRPGASWGGVDAVTFPDGRRRGGGEAVAEAGEFAVDAPVALRRVVSREPDDELFSVTHGAGTARSSLGVPPSGRGEPAVPSEQRVGRDDVSVTDLSGDDPGEPGDQATVDFGQLRAFRGSLQDCDLVTERDDLGLEHPARFAANDHQLDERPAKARSSWALFILDRPLTLRWRASL